MLERDALLHAIAQGCAWLTDVSQIREERIPEECFHISPWQRSWKGAFRGEYSAAEKAWGMFCPVWHSGQAVKALCMAYDLTKEEKWLQSAISAGEFILNQQITDPGSPEFGLIFAVEDYHDCVNTSAILETLDGLLHLSETTADPKYRIAAQHAAAWICKNAYMGNGHFQDNYSLQAHAFTYPDWLRRWIPPAGFEKMDGRPLADDAIFLKMYRLTGEPVYRDVFFATVDHLRTHEVPAGTWNNYGPSNGGKGISHPRQSFWWGMPMYDAYLETEDPVYLDSLRRCGQWYLRAQRRDGSLFRHTDLEFKTPAFNLCTSGICCAALLWMRLYTIDRDPRWMEAVERALEFAMSVQFTRPRDENMRGAILELTEFVPGSDASPYYLRDLATIFFVQAATRYLRLQP